MISDSRNSRKLNHRKIYPVYSIPLICNLQIQYNTWNPGCMLYLFICRANLGQAFRLSRTTFVKKACIKFEYVRKPNECWMLSWTNSQKPLYSDLSGVQIETAAVAITSPSPVEISERTDTTFIVNLIVAASNEAGSAIGDDLWSANLYLSPDSNGTTVLSAFAAADSGTWQATGSYSQQMPHWFTFGWLCFRHLLIFFPPLVTICKELSINGCYLASI